MFVMFIILIMLIMLTILTIINIFVIRVLFINNKNIDSGRKIIPANIRNLFNITIQNWGELFVCH